jgi:hypothetical protein
MRCIKLVKYGSEDGSQFMISRQLPDASRKQENAPELTDDDVRHIVETTAHRVIRLLKRRGVLEGDGFDALVDESPVPVFWVP